MHCGILGRTCSFPSRVGNDASCIDVIECWSFGSKNGFCIGHITWNWKTHHASAFWPRHPHVIFKLAPVHSLAPWELGCAGAPLAGRDEDMKLTPTTRPIAWTFQDPNVPQEVLVASAGPVQCIRTNGDGLCSLHSVFGVICSTGHRDQTELYHNDAKAFIRQSFGLDYTSVFV